VVRRKIKQYWPLAAASAVVVLVAVGLFLLIRSVLGNKDAGPKRQIVQTIQLIRPPPPPPDVPPPPPPDKVEEKLVQNTPDSPKDAEPDTNQQLGLDAEGSAGGDDFGLAARHGGSDLLGGSSSPFAGYVSLVRDAILETLSDDKRVRKGNYSVVVRIWLLRDGRVDRYKLAQATGNQQLDAAIEQDLAHVGRVREAPPLEMPEPLTVKIVSKG
jgi:protein TonB